LAASALACDRRADARASVAAARAATAAAVASLAAARALRACAATGLLLDRPYAHS
jgi:hypothetical protein